MSHYLLLKVPDGVIVSICVETQDAHLLGELFRKAHHFGTETL